MRSLGIPFAIVVAAAISSAAAADDSTVAETPFVPLADGNDWKLTCDNGYTVEAKALAYGPRDDYKVTYVVTTDVGSSESSDLESVDFEGNALMKGTFNGDALSEIAPIVTVPVSPTADFDAKLPTPTGGFNRRTYVGDSMVATDEGPVDAAEFQDVDESGRVVQRVWFARGQGVVQIVLVTAQTRCSLSSVTLMPAGGAGGSTPAAATEDATSAPSPAPWKFAPPPPPSPKPIPTSLPTPTRAPSPRPKPMPAIRCVESAAPVFRRHETTLLTSMQVDASALQPGSLNFDQNAVNAIYNAIQPVAQDTYALLGCASGPGIEGEQLSDAYAAEAFVDWFGAAVSLGADPYASGFSQRGNAGAAYGLLQEVKASLKAHPSERAAEEYAVAAGKYQRVCFPYYQDEPPGPTIIP